MRKLFANRPTLEALEDRLALSATAVLDDATQTLTITGDQAADKVKVVHDDNANQIRVLHDGVTDTFASSAVDKIVVNLKGGNDSFTLALQDGTNFSRPKWLDVRTGAGEDQVMFDLAGNANHWATLKENLAIELRTGKDADTVQINLPYVEIANQLTFNALLGGGNDRFDAIAYGDVGYDGALAIDVWGRAGNDQLFYYGTYNAMGSQYGIDVKGGALLSVLFDGGAGKDRVEATYSGEVDGLCSFYLHGDLQNAGGADTDRVFAHLGTQADSDGDLYGYVLGGKGNDKLQLLVEQDGPVNAFLYAYGGEGFDKCVNTFNVNVQECEA